MTASRAPCHDSTVEPLTGDSGLAAIALRGDAHAAVLDRHRLDFCCGGRRTLAAACDAAGIDVSQVLTELNTAAAARSASSQPPSDWNGRPLPEIIDHIVDGHHAYTRAAIARLGPLVEKVGGRHGAGHPELARVAAAFFELAAELGPHMAREEIVLFPYIRGLASPGASRTPPPFQTVRNPVRMMMMQHDRAAELLAEIRAASRDFATPDDACGSYTALYAGLRELRLDLLTHVSLENNILFPRAIALEDTLSRHVGAAGATAIPGTLK
jgi:regulator of cell morphogenesis and NO signaling